MVERQRWKYLLTMDAQRRRALKIQAAARYPSRRRVVM
jgi:hypothetical protein